MCPEQPLDRSNKVLLLIPEFYLHTPPRSGNLKLYFLPPCCPELNRIEKLWHKMKYTWMAFKARDAKTLEADVDQILAGFRTDYTLSFC